MATAMLDLRKRFGRLVAAHRKRRGLTQDALATAADLSVDMVARIEGGATGARFTTIAKLADALEVDPAEFFAVGAGGDVTQRAALNDLFARLSGLPDRDLQLIADLVEVVLRRR